MNNVGSPADLNNLHRKSKTHLCLKINKSARTFALFLDNKFIKQWTDENEFTGTGTGFGLVAQGQPMRVSNIVIGNWDGQLNLDGPTKPGTEDFVRLANGDKLSGTLNTIANNQVSITATFGKMQIPLERVTAILLSTKANLKARRQAADLYAYFVDGGRLTLNLERLDDQQLIGSSENCGRLTLQRAALQRLQFNIYEPKPDDEEDEWGDSTKPKRRGAVPVPMMENIGMGED